MGSAEDQEGVMTTANNICPEDEHVCDFDWINPYLDSTDEMDEVLVCIFCGRVQWTARQIASKGNESLGEFLNLDKVSE